MNSHEQAQVDQALFGYSDGHRQIAASIRLPSKDQYLLAAATDLAAGVRLNPDDTYLTGLPLQESKRFALIRTWPAIEMPRPGCVWSHVILLDFRLLSSHGDLSDFLEMLKRPNAANQSSYGEPLTVPSAGCRGVAEPDPRVIVDLIANYYSGEQVFLRSNSAPMALDAAVVAVWSQQWPRLRASFSFRTAPVVKRRQTELIDYDVQARVGDSDEVSDDRAEEVLWVMAAAEDAATSRITPLRRFLWRYGRDLSRPRAHFRTLVELYLANRDTDALSVDDALRVFESLPQSGDGDILKRDILGMGSHSPSLIPALAPAGLLQLLASKRTQALPDEGQIRKRFEFISPEQVAQLAQFVVQNGEALGPWENAINAGLVSSATRDSLKGDLPGGIRKLILLSRPELIDQETIAALPNDDLIELASAHREDGSANTFASAMVRRDFGLSNVQLFRSMPSLIFEAAIDAAQSLELNPAWVHVIGDNSAAILQTDWPTRVQRTTELATGLVLLRLPRNTGKPLQVWVDALAFMKDDVSGELRVRLQAFLLRAAFQTKSPASWKLATAVLPELRPIILRAALPNDVYQMLLNDLPGFKTAAYWDLNKRILITLSQLRRAVPDEQALRSLNLSSEDAKTVLYGAEEEEQEEKRSKRSFWWF